MLTLSRKSQEFIKLTIPPSEHEQIVLVGISEIRGDKVRIGVVADKFINIGRSVDRDRLATHRDPYEEDLSQIPTAGGHLVR